MRIYTQTHILRGLYTISKIMRTVIIIVSVFIFGVFIGNYWNALHNPMRPMFVELANETESLIPSVIIEHGSGGLQEKITIVQLNPEETRTIALNHKPGMGFNVAVNYANGEKTEICAGKSKDHWFFRAIITKFGIYSKPIR